MEATRVSEKRARALIIEAPEEWEGCQVRIEHLAASGGVLATDKVSGILEMVKTLGIVLSPQGQSGEIQFFPWSSIIRIILLEGQSRKSR